MCFLTLSPSSSASAATGFRLSGRGRALAQASHERFPLTAQSVFQLPRTIAIAACPRLDAVFVPAIPAGMRVLYAEELEIFFPIRSLFCQRRIAETGLDPCRHIGAIQ